MIGIEPCRARIARAAIRTAALCVLTGALAACETTATGVPGETRPVDPKAAPQRSGEVMPATPNAEDSGQSAAPDETAPPETAAAEPQTLEPAIAALPPPEPEINADPKRLLGMGRSALTDLLGTPSFVRNDSPSFLWRYRDKTCLLDLFLYEDGGAAPKRLKVLHYNARGKDGAGLSAEQCLKRLLLARMEKKSG